MFKISKKRLKEIEKENMELDKLIKKMRVPEEVRNMTTAELFAEIRKKPEDWD